MTHNIHILIFAYALDVRPLVNAIMTDGVTLHLYVHSDRKDVVSACREMQSRHSGVRLYDYRVNRGTEKSFNDGIQMALTEKADATIALNDDLAMSQDDLAMLIEGCVNHSECGLITCNGYNISADLYHNLSFGCFGINRTAIDVAGYLDENFWPAYFSDTDYRRRCELLGVQTYNVGDTGIVHQGSATIRAVPALQASYPLNQRYYEAKHGGSPGSETFVFPFNDLNLSWTIPAETRDNPYPAHQRLGLML